MKRLSHYSNFLQDKASKGDRKASEDTVEELFHDDKQIINDNLESSD